ncbi:MAG: riboflavin synthase [bacterium]|nr:riboflavin synthase [bacterium]
MFTGLIETVGRIEALKSRGNYTVITVSSAIPTEQITIGESIACDGACLTVTSIEADRFVVEASQETAEKTTLRRFRVGGYLNLERALQVGSRLGGHFVSGHIDSTGTVDFFKPVGDSLELAVKYDADFDPYVIDKGSVAINGVSLTVNRTRSGWFSVNLIPHTARETTLDKLSSGSPVNLEFDLIGKYVVKMKTASSKGGLTVDTILNSGW